MNNKQTLLLVLSLVGISIIFGSIPNSMADSDGTKSYKHFWGSPIGDLLGSLEITEDTDKTQLLESAISLKDAITNYSDIDRARLGMAVNNDDKYFLVWKLSNIDFNSETNITTKTTYLIDAGNGEQLGDPVTKEREGYKHHGSCGNKDKSQTTETSINQA